MSRLIVGSGKHFKRQKGDTLVDIKPFDGVDVVHDLNVIPWPFEDNSYDEIIALHVVEHLQSLVNFMDESWRILKKDGILHIETPLAGSGNVELEWADPTHIRCFTTYSFHNYFTDHGVAQFGYTDRIWDTIKLHTEPINPHLGLHPDVVVYKGTPRK